MALTAGIVGLPNVGKSTLFNAITKAGALAANYPFATIDPNVGIVEVPDSRLLKLEEMVQPKKTIPTTFEFTDIAGIVKGASKGEGLGNKFLSHIREVDAICQVVRAFDDENVTHVSGRVNPLDDIEVINMELVLADLESVEKRLPKIEKMARQKDKTAEMELRILSKIKETLEEGKPVRSIEFNDEDQKWVNQAQLLTSKKMLYIANVGEDEIGDEENDKVKAIRDYAAQEDSEVIVISAKIEEEIATLDDEDKEMFLEDLGIEEPGLDRLIRTTYDLLGLSTYFTAGVQEVRAWTFVQGMTAPQCAGIIHTDFERGFIRAEVTSYSDYVEHGGENGAKEAGRQRLEGKDYIMQDGDIVHFRFNV
ncbi:redox-regulated ATPase YchF [Staphylococcus warneri]|jgi:GTP-binding protein YchF|uniref:Ribosome-binding ATPase YchF n=3 Tax=Staphylococcus TaxID=1279 RepID=A0A2T4PHF4_STAWA|nr:MULTISPECIES: redox-regulated ATPase YchF [Staphylococcus]MBE9429462.1 redox-regulated ATPase YchF [Staphylococcus epidermidis]MBJ7884475.1 redox-regulated ATPase YchF [Bacillaceae bacterium HSR45]MCA4046769.1 redox-regulated ATPase YchF [Pseudomonas aeruginosa]QAV30901.1 redox-regulated ATPase YchF [Sulfitobacter donghicola]COS23119.1 GTP-dependent nucleic acid-binding protein EngD [Streptococcus pneumoniae]SKR56556.1 Probable GTP binding protein [Mycobacteroides abscessus subsp. abscessu